VKLLIQRLVSVATTNPWILIIVYYIIKQVIKAFISLLMDQKADIPSHIYDMGPDLCFMGFTLFAAIITSDLKKLEVFTNQSLAIFFYTISLIGLYAFSYSSLQGFKKAGKWYVTQNRKIFNTEIKGKWLVVALRSLLISLSIFFGATAFGIIIELGR